MTIAHTDTDPLHDLGRHVQAALPDGVTDVAVTRGELVLQVEAQAIRDVVGYLRDDPKCLFVCFVDICGVDYPER